MRKILTGMLTVALLLSAVTIDVRAAGEAGDIVSTFAGTGGHGAADGERAQFNLPRSVLASSRGVFVADSFNNLIRSIDYQGYVSTLAGKILGLDAFRFPIGLYRDGDIDGALFNRPADMIVGAGGNLFVLDSGNHTLRIIIQDNVFTFAGTGQPGHNDGPVTTAQFNRPFAMASGPDGSIYIADSGNHVIRRISANGNVTTVAGQPGEYGHYDGTTDGALFNGPMGVAVDSRGRIFVADTGNHLIRMIYNGNVTTLAGNLFLTDGMSEWDDAPLGGFADGQNNLAMFNMPQGLAIWRGDILIIADTGNHRIRALMPDGRVLTLAGNGFPGHDDGLPDEATFHLPENISVWGDILYIADTGNNVIRKIILSDDLLVTE